MLARAGSSTSTDEETGALAVAAEELDPLEKMSPRATLRSILNLNYVDYVIAAISGIYLMIVAADMVMDDVLTQYVPVPGGNGTCGIDGASVGRQFTSLTIDLYFLIFFAAESLLRIFAFGPLTYFKNALNIIDATVVVIGLVIDILFLQGVIQASFSLLRLGRATRLVRIFVLYKRFKARKAALVAKRQLAIVHVAAATTCNWSTCKRKPPGIMYASFLSHQKAEGATTARYLHDRLQLICGVDSFLDSSDLGDLRELMKHLRQSEVLVFIATKSVLQSVWVLLEVYTATKMGIPVVPIFDSTFDPKVAVAYLGDLEQQLAQINKAFLATLRAKLHEDHFEGSIADFGQVIVKALQLDGPQAVNHLVFYANASDQVMEATCTALVKKLAEVTSRTLKWTETQFASSSFSTSDGNVKWAVLCKALGVCGCAPAPDAEEKKFKFFIACNPSDQMPEPMARVASFLQLRLQGEVRGPVVMEPVDIDGNKRALSSPSLVAAAGSKAVDAEIENFSTFVIDEGVLRSRALVILLTANVLYRPWTLVQVYEAIRAGIPVISVLIDGGGYDFAHASALLTDLASGLEKAEGDTTSLTLLHQLCYARRISPRRLQMVLKETLAHLLAITFRPGNGVEYTDAVMKDIVLRASNSTTSDTHASAAASSLNASTSSDAGNAAKSGAAGHKPRRQTLNERAGFMRYQLKSGIGNVVAKKRMQEMGIEPEHTDGLSDWQKRDVIKISKAIDGMKRSRGPGNSKSNSRNPSFDDDDISAAVSTIAEVEEGGEAVGAPALKVAQVDQVEDAAVRVSAPKVAQVDQVEIEVDGSSSQYSAAEAFTGKLRLVR